MVPRVAVVSRIFTPESAAATFRLQAVVRALTGRGAHVDVVTADPPPGQDADDGAHAPGAAVHRAPVLRDEAGYVRGYLPYLSFDLPLAARLATLARPDVILVEPPPTTGAVVRVVAALRGVPYAYYAADVWSDATASMGAPTPVVRLMRAVERFALRGAREVIAVSDGVAERVRALGASRVSVVPNGIDTDMFSPDGRAHQDAPSASYLLYAGTASEWQGAEVFAAAMGQVLGEVPDARLVFLGQGSSWPALQRMRDQLPDGAIQLRPLVPPAEAAAWQRGARAGLVSVRPGVGYDLAYPTKILAALACGTPVLLAAPPTCPAVPDIATHPELGECASYDVDAVAAAMVRALRTVPGATDVRQQRAVWVREHRSLAATGRAVADLLLAGVRPNRQSE